MKGASLRIGFTVLLLTLVSCNYSDRKQPQSGEFSVEATRESIQRNVVNVSCLRCHTQATPRNHGVELTDILSLTSAPEHAPGGHHHSALILPGCPKQSLFVSILKEGKMPPPPEQPLPATTIATIETWITSLKPGTNCNSDEPGGPDSDGNEPE